MKSQRIIGFTLLFALLFLLIGLNTASASSSDYVVKNLSDSLESSQVFNVDLDASDSLESSQDSNADLGISEDIGSDSVDDVLSSDEILKENADSEIFGDDGKTVHTITENDYFIGKSQ